MTMAREDHLPAGDQRGAARQEMQRDPTVVVFGEDVVGGSGAAGRWTPGAALGRHQGLTPSSPSASSTRRSPSRRSSGRRSAPPRPGCVRSPSSCSSTSWASASTRSSTRGRSSATCSAARRRCRSSCGRPTAPGSAPRAALTVPLPDLHAHPGAQGRDPVEPLRREGPPRARDPRRRPRHLLREQGPVRDGGRRARGALHDPLRRGERSSARAATSPSSRSGAWCRMAEQAAGELAGDGIECEVIDPRTTSPLDEETIYESVERTGRLVVVDEATLAAGSRPTLSRARRAELLRRAQGAAPPWSRRRTPRCRSARCSRTPTSRAPSDRGRGREAVGAVKRPAAR